MLNTDVEGKGDSQLRGIFTPEILMLLSDDECRKARYFIERFVNDQTYAAHSAKKKSMPDVTYNEPLLANALNDYIILFHERGMYDRMVNHLQNPEKEWPLDWSMADEVALAAIWLSFYLVHKHTDLYDWSDHRKMAFRVAKWLKRIAWQNSPEIKGRLFMSDDGYLEYPANPMKTQPERVYLMNERTSDLIDTFAGLSKRKTKMSVYRQQFFSLLAEGATPSEAAAVLGIEASTSLYWINQCRQNFPQYSIERIKTQADGEWIWDNETAELLLHRCSLYLNETEIQLLNLLQLHGDVKTLLDKEHLHERTIYTNLYGIKVKVQSYGEVSRDTLRDTGYTWQARRRLLISQMREIVPNDAEEQRILVALNGSGGHIVNAEKELDSGTKKAITSFLGRKGYH